MMWKIVFGGQDPRVISLRTWLDTVKITAFKWGAVAEWVERRSLNPEVLGSNPTDAVSNLGQVRLSHVALV